MILVITYFSVHSQSLVILYILCKPASTWICLLESLALLALWSIMANNHDWHTYFLRRKQTGVFHDGMTHSALQTPIITSTERIQPLLWTPLTRNYLSTYITFMPFDAFVHAQYPSSFTGKSCSPLWLQLPQQDFAVCHFLSQVCHLHVL